MYACHLQSDFHSSRSVVRVVNSRRPAFANRCKQLFTKLKSRSCAFSGSITWLYRPAAYAKAVTIIELPCPTLCARHLAHASKSGVIVLLSGRYTANSSPCAESMIDSVPACLCCVYGHQTTFSARSSMRSKRSRRVAWNDLRLLGTSARHHHRVPSTTSPVAQALKPLHPF